MRIKHSVLPFPATLLFSFILIVPSGFSTETQSAFDWMEVPPTRTIRPESIVRGESFRMMEKTDRGLTVFFEHPTLTEKTPDVRDRFQFIVVSPAGGIAEVTFEATSPIYYKGEEIVQPVKAPNPSVIGNRIVQKELGEIRGAVLTSIEFLPLASIRGSTEVNRAWLPQATLTITFERELTDPKEAHPLFREGVGALAINAIDYPRCLSDPDPVKWIDEDRLSKWTRPTLKIRTKEEGWTSLPGRRLLGEWGREIEVTQLEVLERGSLVQIPDMWKEEADTLPRQDSLVPSFVLTATGEIRDKGRMLPSDTLVFKSEVSDFWNDPRNCYWIVYDESLNPSSRVADPPGNATETHPLKVSARKTETIGEDRMFVEGGLQNEKQEFFWVDQVFPEGEDSSVRIGLPAWVAESKGGVQANARILFPSSLRDRYQPAGFLRPNDFSIWLGDATAEANLTGAPSRFGHDVGFLIPPGIDDASIEIRFHPSRNTPSPPYFDRLILEGTEEMIWDGQQRSYDFPSSSAGLLKISRTGKGMEAPPRVAIALDSEREIVRIPLTLFPDRLECQVPASIRSLYLLSGQTWKSPVSVEQTSLPAWLHNPLEADQLVVTPHVFRSESQEIVRLLETEGHSAVVVEIESVFDVFSGGQFSAHALRNFLTWITHTWPHPQPASLLLVGDSSWDYWGRFKESDRVPNWTPSYHIERDPDYPTDLWFVEGAPADRIADWLWGRIPCQSVAHLQGYLAKRRAFDRPSPGEWASRLLWISDDNDPVARDVQEILKQVLPLSYRLHPIFLHDYAYVDNFYYGPNLERIQQEARDEAKPLDFGKISPECNQAILDEFTQGAALVVYYGHSGLNVLGHERILFGGGSQHSDIPKLNNEGKAPLFFLMTCDVGRFDYTHERLWKWSFGLAEELLMHPFGGALALVTSTGRGVPSDHQILLTECLDSLLQGGAIHAGSMLWAAKVKCLLSPRNNKAIEMFTLLGDPLFVPPIPVSEDILRAKRLRWIETGNLEIETEISSASPIEILNSRWIDPKKMEEHEVHKWTLSQSENRVTFEIPQSHNRQELWLVYEYQSTESSSPPKSLQSGKLVLDLSRIERPDWKNLSAGELPNLVVTSEDLIYENYSPKRGETQFITVNVHNRGQGVAWDIDVVGREEGSEEPVLNMADSFPPAQIDRLDPGESAKVRLRWDHWGDVGRRTLEVVLDPENRIEESDEADNLASKAIKILDKADLAWGFVRDSTAGAVSFEQARAVPNDWILDPGNAELGQWAPLRSYLHDVDRGAMILVPLTNWGEISSSTCSIDLRYYRKGSSDPFREAIEFRVGPIAPVDSSASGKKFPILLLPDLDRVEIRIDPERELEEQSRDNNILRFQIPSYFWEDIPTQKPKRTLPKVIERFKLDE